MGSSNPLRKENGRRALTSTRGALKIDAAERQKPLLPESLALACEAFAFSKPKQGLLGHDALSSRGRIEVGIVCSSHVRTVAVEANHPRRPAT